jgi:hypothetical protein
VRRAERARFLCSVDFGGPYDGLEPEFNFFNVLEGGVCTMCSGKSKKIYRESRSGVLD